MPPRSQASYRNTSGRQTHVFISAVLTFIIRKCRGESTLTESSTGHGRYDVKIQIINQSEKGISLHWIKPETQELSFLSDVRSGSTYRFGSYLSHAFELQETGKCRDANCRSSHFTVNSTSDQEIYINNDMQIRQSEVAVDSPVGFVSACHQQALGWSGSASSTHVIDNLIECVKPKVATALQRSKDDLSFEKRVRNRMGDLFDDYVCADAKLGTTNESERRLWTHHGTSRKVRVLHERAASKIHLLENFISEEECNEIEKAAEDKFYAATTYNNDGKLIVSSMRRAKQANVKVPWELEAQGNPIAQLSRRAYDYTERILGFDMDVHDQEHLKAIRYTGRGLDDKEPDRYLSHCDGDCSGEPYEKGERMASMVMYCQVPEVGGSTTFKNAGVHIVPRKGNAVFFNYINPDDFMMDTGFTKHSGCPVFVGTKMIVTQWMKLGVDAQSS